MRDLSDHSPIWIKGNNSIPNYGPKPFKFFNYWLDHKDFLPLVSNLWNSCSINGNVAFVLKEKLKGLKGCIRTWNKECFGILELNVESSIKNLNDFDLLEDDDLSEEAQSALSITFV